MSALGSKLRQFKGGIVAFRCPGCDMAHQVAVSSLTIPNRGFNDDDDKPTFTPSVLVTHMMSEPPVTPENFEEYKRNPWPQTKVKHICHSFVTDGMIQFLGDCTHALAEQTVPLPDFDVELP